MNANSIAVANACLKGAGAAFRRPLRVAPQQTTRDTIQQKIMEAFEPALERVATVDLNLSQGRKAELLRELAFARNETIEDNVEDIMRGEDEDEKSLKLYSVLSQARQMIRNISAHYRLGTDLQPLKMDPQPTALPTGTQWHAQGSGATASRPAITPDQILEASHALYDAALKAVASLRTTDAEVPLTVARKKEITTELRASHNRIRAALLYQMGAPHPPMVEMLSTVIRQSNQNIRNILLHYGITYPIPHPDGSHSVAGTGRRRCRF